eukprot:g3588.t1
MSRIDYSKWDKLEIEDSSDSSSSSDDDDKEEAVSRSTTRRGSSLKMFENALDHSEKLRKAGNTLFEKNQKKNAKTLYLQALSILQPLQNIRDTNLREKWKNEIVKNHLNIAAIAGESENFAEVVRHAEAALKNAPDSSNAHHALGAALSRLGGSDGEAVSKEVCMSRAIQHLTRACDLNPKDKNMRETLEDAKKGYKLIRKDLGSASATTTTTVTSLPRPSPPPSSSSSSSPSPPPANWMRRVRELHQKATRLHQAQQFDDSANTWTELLRVIKEGGRGGGRSQMEGGVHRQLAAAYRGAQKLEKSQKHYALALRTFGESSSYGDTRNAIKMAGRNPAAVKRVLRRSLVLLEKAQCAMDLGTCEADLERARKDFQCLVAELVGTKTSSTDATKEGHGLLVVDTELPLSALHLVARARLGEAKCLLGKRAASRRRGQQQQRAKKGKGDERTTDSARGRSSSSSSSTTTTTTTTTARSPLARVVISLVQAAMWADHVIENAGEERLDVRLPALQVTAEANETIGGLYAEVAANDAGQADRRSLLETSSSTTSALEKENVDDAKRSETVEREEGMDDDIDAIKYCYRVASKCFERASDTHARLYRTRPSKVTSQTRNRLLLMAAVFSSRNDPTCVRTEILFKNTHDVVSEAKNDPGVLRRALTGLANVFFRRGDPKSLSESVRLYKRALKQANDDMDASTPIRAMGRATERSQIIVSAAKVMLATSASTAGGGGSAADDDDDDDDDGRLAFVRNSLCSMDAEREKLMPHLVQQHQQLRHGEGGSATTSALVTLTSGAAELLLILGRLHHNIEDVESALGNMREALKRFQELQRIMGRKGKDGEGCASAAAAAVASTASSPSYSLAVYAKRQQAVALQAIGTLSSDVATLREGLTILESLNDRRSAGGVLRSIGALLAKQERFPASCTAFASACDSFRAAEDAVGEALSWVSLARVQKRMSATDVAKESIDRAVALSKGSVSAFGESPLREIEASRREIHGEGPDAEKGGA